jgi:hypothetical protein
MRDSNIFSGAASKRARETGPGNAWTDRQLRWDLFHAQRSRRRPDGITAQINVCEHPAPVAELRRIYDAISETLGFRELQQFSGSDVYQLRVMLHALGRYRPDVETIAPRRESMVYTQDLVDAVDAFRREHGLATPDLGSPPGYVDRAFLAALWQALDDAGKGDEVRLRLTAITQVRR